MCRFITGLLALAALVAASLPVNALIASAPSDIGSTVDASLRGKPLVVRVHANWCGECQTTLPDFMAFVRAHRGKLNVVDVDVTDAKTSAVAQSRAKRLGLGAFYERTKAQPLTVAFINPNSGRLYAALRGNVTLGQLEAAEKAVKESLARR
jgi:thiol-disulfide isomerase/thioredoxin